jgi:hypothetical protein
MSAAYRSDWSDWPFPGGRYESYLAWGHIFQAGRDRMPPHVLVHLIRWAVENPLPALGIIAVVVVSSFLSMTAFIILAVLAVAGMVGIGIYQYRQEEAGQAGGK